MRLVLKKHDVEIAALFYLFLPFIIFAFGWYQLWLAVIVLLALAWSLWRIYKSGLSADAFDEIRIDRKLGWALLLLGVWVLFSGVGGYGFQNNDFKSRNAIFYDLIHYSWPVLYPVPGQLPMQLVYYIGYWLPAALIGKALGLAAANLSLFLWTLLGVLLVVQLISFRLNVSSVPVAIFLILFSGMDFVPTVIRAHQVLWPPYWHLEWWTKGMQYSSLTTQLYWVFNQAVPAWICLALFWGGAKKAYLGLLGALCLFYAPLPAVGFAPYIAIRALDISAVQYRPILIERWFPRIKGNLHLLWKSSRTLLSIENILAGGLVILLTLVYFRSNQTASQYSLHYEPGIFIQLGKFFLIEGGAIWLLLLFYRRDRYWLLTGILLLICPLARVGFGWDFCMRASIPALFFLMVGCAEVCLLKEVRRRTLPLAVVLAPLLILGILTPIYEINRSVYFSLGHYLCVAYQQNLSFCDGGVWTAILVPADRVHPTLEERWPFLGDQDFSLATLDFNRPSNFVSRLDRSALSQFLLLGAAQNAGP